MIFNLITKPVPVIKAKEAKGISTPINLVAAKNDIIFPGKKMLKRAKKLFSSLKYSVLLEDSKHVQDQKGNEFVEQILLKRAESNSN